MTCADTHKSQLMKDNCTEAVVQEFCEKAPPAPTPAEECLRAEEMYCGNDRHNKTLCIKCIALHATELKNKTCTTEEDEKFCDKPAPPNPTAECYQELKKLCQADRSVHAECVACVDKHVNETKAAHCTYTQVEAFCGPQPNPTPPMHCFADMNTLCAKAKVGGEAACVACIKTNAARLEKDHCTAVSDNPPTPPGACVCVCVCIRQGVHACALPACGSLTSLYGCVHPPHSYAPLLLRFIIIAGGGGRVLPRPPTNPTTPCSNRKLHQRV
jgi:hypothetical protein